MKENRNNDTIHTLSAIASKVRGKVIELSHQAGTPHLGSSLSCVDIVVSAYFGGLNITPQNVTDSGRDRFILSKGHAATTLYTTLAYRGFFSTELLDTYGKEGSTLAEHPSPQCQPGIEAPTGSLGHGLPIGIGMALATKIMKQRYNVVVLMSDGECNEGSVWEGALFAPAQKLGNLCVVIDYNKWQATGRSQEVMALEPLADKWCSFGWDVEEIDGHDIKCIYDKLSTLKQDAEKPRAIVAHTVKGKGVSFMEDDNNWHYRIPNEAEVSASLQELGLL